MTEKKTKIKNTSKLKIGGILLLADAIYLTFIGISPLFGILIPAIKLVGTLGSSLNGWIIYSINNIMDLLGGLIVHFKWQNFLDFLIILVIFTVNILFYIGGGISFHKRNIIAFIGVLLFIIGIILILIDLFIENLIFEFIIPPEITIVLSIIDTNVLCILILGSLGGYFSYFMD
ncbi:MAG: hypothetical protein ACFFCM_02700 [Promethearchaeota archaeon]